ncbi:hypothetical protein [Agromyces sp. PvR057]|uniref:hypothetical protein n=1 Tax=Agromyces sp. PvR057 TaxID=3156403 RepID=UPI000E2587C6
MPQHDLAARLRSALNHGDELALAGVLHREASMVIDSGDEAGGESHGRVGVITAFHELRMRHRDASFSTVHVNGRAGLALRRPNGEVVAVLSVDGTTVIAKLWLCTSLPKLASWNRRRPESG